MPDARESSIPVAHRGDTCCERKTVERPRGSQLYYMPRDIAFPDAPALPNTLRAEASINVDDASIIAALQTAVASLLLSLPNLGHFGDGDDNGLLERFETTCSVFTNFPTRRALYLAAAEHQPLLAAHERLMREVVLPCLARRLALAGDASERFVFEYQSPPTVRVQPPDARVCGKIHRDAEYGHQPGEINVWMPLTRRAATHTTLWVESAPGASDFHPLDVEVGRLAMFHGTLCRHHAPANTSTATRVSLDFRVGIRPYYDPHWRLPGVRAQHTRRECILARPPPDPPPSAQLSDAVDSEAEAPSEKYTHTQEEEYGEKPAEDDEVHLLFIPPDAFAIVLAQLRTVDIAVFARCSHSVTELLDRARYAHTIGAVNVAARSWQRWWRGAIVRRGLGVQLGRLGPLPREVSLPAHAVARVPLERRRWQGAVSDWH